MTITAEIADVVARIRREASDLHAELPRNELVVWTAGNVSARVPGRDLLGIKPSGVRYDQLSPEAMVVTDLDGRLVDGDGTPSSDTAAHAYTDLLQLGRAVESYCVRTNERPTTKG